MTIEMEVVQIRRQFDIAYSELLSQFISISKPHLTASVLNELKVKYSCVINSTRTSEYIKSIEGLLKILEKRGALSYDNIEILKDIANTYVRDEVLERTLTNYEGQSRRSLPAHNRYLMQSATAHRYEAQPSPSGSNTVYNNASQINRLPMQVTMYTTQPTFQITLPGSLYMDSTSQIPANSESQVMTRVFQEISQKLGRHWRDVARYLRVTEYDIDEIQSQMNLTLSEKALKALLKFQSKCDPLEWKPKLKQALEKARRRDVMDLVDEISS